MYEEMIGCTPEATDDEASLQEEEDVKKVLIDNLSKQCHALEAAAKACCDAYPGVTNLQKAIEQLKHAKKRYDASEQEYSRRDEERSEYEKEVAELEDLIRKEGGKAKRTKDRGEDDREQKTLKERMEAAEHKLKESTAACDKASGDKQTAQQEYDRCRRETESLQQDPSLTIVSRNQAWLASKFNIVKRIVTQLQRKQVTTRKAVSVLFVLVREIQVRWYAFYQLVVKDQKHSITISSYFEAIGGVLYQLCQCQRESTWFRRLLEVQYSSREAFSRWEKVVEAIDGWNSHYGGLAISRHGWRGTLTELRNVVVGVLNITEKLVKSSEEALASCDVVVVRSNIDQISKSLESVIEYHETIECHLERLRCVYYIQPGFHEEVIELVKQAGHWHSEAYRHVTSIHIRQDSQEQRIHGCWKQMKRAYPVLEAAMMSQADQGLCVPANICQKEKVQLKEPIESGLKYAEMLVRRPGDDELINAQLRCVDKLAHPLNTMRSKGLEVEVNEFALPMAMIRRLSMELLAKSTKTKEWDQKASESKPAVVKEIHYVPTDVGAPISAEGVAVVSPVEAVSSNLRLLNDSKALGERAEHLLDRSGPYRSDVEAMIKQLKNKVAQMEGGKAISAAVAKSHRFDLDGYETVIETIEALTKIACAQLGFAQNKGKVSQVKPVIVTQ